MLVPPYGDDEFLFYGEKRLEWWDFNVGNLGLLL